MRISVKILGTKSRQRYAVRRLVLMAQTVLQSEYPNLEVEITEIKEPAEIARYTPVMIAPGVVIDEKLVYDIWIPSKEQVMAWLREAIEEAQVVNN